MPWKKKKKSSNLIVLIFYLLIFFMVVLSLAEKYMLNFPLHLVICTLVLIVSFFVFVIRCVWMENNYVFLVKFYQYEVRLLNNSTFFYLKVYFFWYHYNYSGLLYLYVCVYMYICVYVYTWYTTLWLLFNPSVFLCLYLSLKTDWVFKNPVWQCLSFNWKLIHLHLMGITDINGSTSTQMLFCIICLICSVLSLSSFSLCYFKKLFQTFFLYRFRVFVLKFCSFRSYPRK